MYLSRDVTFDELSFVSREQLSDAILPQGEIRRSREVSESPVVLPIPPDSVPGLTPSSSIDSSGASNSQPVELKVYTRQKKRVQSTLPDATHQITSRDSGISSLPDSSLSIPTSDLDVPIALRKARSLCDLPNFLIVRLVFRRD